MSEKRIHIISFDIPYPPIYGGIIDVYYKIKSLHSLGYQITLHCFQYRDKKESIELDKLCHNVYYYKRKEAYKVFFSVMPYIVSSRSNEELLSNLLDDTAPILFEGLHTCFYLGHPTLKDRNKIVWMHNIEADYYRGLSQADKNFIHKIHFSVESRKLKMFESVLYSANTIFSVNQADAEYMKQYCVQSYFVPPFHLNEDITVEKGRGDYILYHGSLDVIENHQAALYLVQAVFSKIDRKVIIAGRNPKSGLIDLIKKHKHIKLQANVSNTELTDLIKNAQCHVFFTFQSTGLKHKLLNALFRGRHVIANQAMVLNSGLEKLCQIANTPDEILTAIANDWNKEITDEEIRSREFTLQESYSNIANAKKMIPYLNSKT